MSAKHRTRRNKLNRGWDVQRLDDGTWMNVGFIHAPNGPVGPYEATSAGLFLGVHATRKQAEQAITLRFPAEVQS